MKTRNASSAGVLALVVMIASDVLSGLPVRPGLEQRGKIQFNTPVRVLLQKRMRSVTIEWNQSALYVADAQHSSWLPGKGRLLLNWRDTARGPRVVANKPATISSDLWLAPADSNHGLLKLNGKFYRGAIEIKPDADGLLVINKLPVEEYLLGMLPGEMSAEWEPEALKAQAVAARSYALYRTLFPRSPHFDLESGTMDQVYLGEGSEKPNTTIAVRATEGLYLSENGDPIEAYFHARCGGSTETSRAVWNTETPAGNQRVSCPFCKKRPYHWSATWNKRRFLEALRINASPFSKIFLRAATKSPTGRLNAIEVATNEGSTTLTSDQFRSLLGYDQLKSALFNWQIAENEIHFDGVGYGHGVGMCQWGARQLARQGRDFRRILSYYYPGVRLASNAPKKSWN